MKKKLFVIVVLSFTLALSGCGGADRQETEESVTVEETTEPPESEQEAEKEKSSDFDINTNQEVSNGGFTYSLPSSWTDGTEGISTSKLYYAESGESVALFQLSYSSDDVSYDELKNQKDSLVASYGQSYDNFFVESTEEIEVAGINALDTSFSGEVSGVPCDGRIIMFSDEELGNVNILVFLQAYNTKYDHFDDFDKVVESAKRYESSNSVDPSSSSLTEETAPSIQSYGPGTLKVGTDIPAGEYIVISTESYGGYFSVNVDANGDDIVFNSMFDYNSIVTVNDGEYFELSRAKAYPFDQWCAQNTIDLSKTGVMLKVGVNIPAGDYQLSAESEDAGYYCIYSSSRQDDIVANNLFEGQDYVSVSDGQYLELSRCTIVQ